MTKDATVVKEVKDSLEEAIGKEVEFTIKGKLYKLSQASIGDYKAFRGYVRTNRIKDFRDSAIGLDSADRQEVLYRLSSHVMNEAELMAEVMTLEGQIYMLWCMLKRGNEDFIYSLDEFNAVMDEDSMQDMITVMQGISPEPEPLSDPPEGTD